MNTIWESRMVRWLSICVLALFAMIVYENAPAQSVTVPLPTNCSPGLTGPTSGAWVVSCSGVTPPPTPPPPPPPGPISCPGFAATHVITAIWGSTGQTIVGDGPNDALVLKFTIPASAGSLQKAGSAALAEYQSPTNPRYGALSSQPCDFTGVAAVTVNGDGPEIFCLPTSAACSTSVNANWATNPAKTGSGLVYVGQTYYINIGNQVGTCTQAGVCDVVVNWSWPSK